MSRGARLDDVPTVRRPRLPLRGRRITDPPDRSPAEDVLAVRGRLAGVSVRAAMGAGAWVGFALGITLGAIGGALLVWFSGALLDWQRDLAFTFGIARRLLPFGDQVGVLRTIAGAWPVVIPLGGLVVGALVAILGAVVGGLIAATYNRTPRHALVVVELPRRAALSLTAETRTERRTDGMVDSRPHGVDREE